MLWPMICSVIDHAISVTKNNVWRTEEPAIISKFNLISHASAVSSIKNMPILIVLKTTKIEKNIER